MSASGTDDTDAPRALAAMDHDQLVAYLDRLYALLDQPPLSASAARASTDDELRARIATVLRRLAARSGRAEPRGTAPPPDLREPGLLAPMDGPGTLAEPGRARATERGRRRACGVLFTIDRELATRARSMLSRHGIPLLVADTAESLARMLAGIVPTDLVVECRPDSAVGRADLVTAVGLQPPGLRVHWTTSAETTIAAILALRSER